MSKTIWLFQIVNISLALNLVLLSIINHIKGEI